MSFLSFLSFCFIPFTPLIILHVTCLFMFLLLTFISFFFSIILKATWLFVSHSHLLALSVHLSLFHDSMSNHCSPFFFITSWWYPVRSLTTQCSLFTSPLPLFSLLPYSSSHLFFRALIQPVCNITFLLSLCHFYSFALTLWHSVFGSSVDVSVCCLLLPFLSFLFFFPFSSSLSCSPFSQFVFHSPFPHISLSF